MGLGIEGMYPCLDHPLGADTGLRPVCLAVGEGR